MTTDHEDPSHRRTAARK